MSAAEVVVIVGAGLAGARAAETLRGNGFAGSIVMFGDEPTAPYHRPPLSKSLLVDEPEMSTLLVHPEAGTTITMWSCGSAERSPASTCRADGCRM